MSKFEKGYSREVYDKTAEDETSLKAQIAEAKSADEMMAIAMKLKETEGKKTELDNEAYDEAMTEEQERTRKEKEEAESKMWDEALAENAEFDQNKELDKAAENLKNQLGLAKSADEMIELAKQMKEIESRKAVLVEKSRKELESASQRDKSDSSEKAEKIISGLGGMMGDGLLTNKDVTEFKKAELKSMKETEKDLGMFKSEEKSPGKITEMLDTPKVLELRRVREKEYKERILDDLKNNTPQDKEVMVLMLKDKIGSFDDETSPVFVYGKENVGGATKVINEWVDNIDSKHYMLPALATEYFFSIMDENQFEKAVENPSLVSDENLRKAVEKYKRAVEKEKSSEEKMDDYIESFLKIGGEHGVYNLIFQIMRDDKDIDFLNNDKMILRFIKGMGNVDAVSYLNSYCQKKLFSKNTVLEIIKSMPVSEDSNTVGGYNGLRILAMNAGIEKDRDVIEAIVRKNKNMAGPLFGNSPEDYRAVNKIITEGPDAYFKK